MINETGTTFLILQNLTYYVFGHSTITFLVLSMFLTLFAILIQIPLPFAIALNIPLTIVLAAYNFIPVWVAFLMGTLYLVLSVFAFITKYT